MIVYEQAIPQLVLRTCCVLVPISSYCVLVVMNTKMDVEMNFACREFGLSQQRIEDLLCPFILNNS